MNQKKSKTTKLSNRRLWVVPADEPWKTGPPTYYAVMSEIDPWTELVWPRDAIALHAYRLNDTVCRFTPEELMKLHTMLEFDPTLLSPRPAWSCLEITFDV